MQKMVNQMAHFLVSVPKADEDGPTKEASRKAKEEDSISRLREKYEGSKRIDKKLFSGKGLKNLGNT